MTREEAIQVLKEISATLKSWNGFTEYPQAIDMAIEALQAEESVTLYATPKATYVRPLTEEIAIEFLQDSGWLPNHDKEIGNPSMLVRCKDCRWWSCTDSLYQHNSHLCRYWKSTNTSAEDFCSYGERQCNYFGERREP